MDPQQVLESYIRAPGSQGDKYWEALSDSVRALVHRAVGKREVGDLDDFEEECVLSIWSKISAIKNGDGTAAIENIEAFVRQAVHNRYCDAIRRKRPKWYNLKLDLLELFSGKANIEGFALWHDARSGSRICGFSDWAGSPKTATGRIRELLDNPSLFRSRFLSNRDPNELPSHELAACILDYCGAPVEVDALTSCIADLTQSHSSEPLSIDAVPDDDEDSTAPVNWLVSPDIEVEKQVVDSSWFNHVIEWFWGEFTALSLKQRKAVLYGLAPDQVMALGSSVGLGELARSLELTTQELAVLISGLPLPDSVTADQLGIQARAVPSVRFKAWGRIRRRTRKSALAAEELA